MSREVCGICWCPYDEDTGECACAPPATPNCSNCASLQEQNTELDRKLAEMEAKLNNQNVDDAFRILAEANRRAIDYINELDRQINDLKRAAPPQRKPLTEKEIDSIWDSEKAFADIYAIARAIERAHGIGGNA